jgi:hypothetical protein
VNFVKLTKEEIVLAAHVGVQRNAEDLGDGMGIGHFDALSDGGWCVHILGAMGEVAFAKHIGKPFVPTPIRGVDIDGRQVRATMERHGRLPIRAKDGPEEMFVLMVLWGSRTFLVAGQISGEEGRRVGVLGNPRNGGPAHFVHQSKLHPVTPVLARESLDSRV